MTKTHCRLQVNDTIKWEKVDVVQKEKHQVCFLYLPKPILLTNPMLPGSVSEFSFDPSDTVAILRLLHFTIDIKDERAGNVFQIFMKVDVHYVLRKLYTPHQ